MALIENLINVIVPLIICGLIFVYFRRRITNLEQSVDIMMKMIQTNEIRGSCCGNDNLFVPPLNANSSAKNVNVTDSQSGSENEDTDDSDSESDESDSDDSDDSDNESDKLESQDTLQNSVKEESHEIHETPLLVAEVNSSDNNPKTVSIKTENELTLSKDELENRNLVELKKLLKDKNPSINNLSRMNKQTVIENLTNN